MDLTRLREQTAAEHAGTEETVPLMSADLTRDAYADTLRRFHRVVAAWDRWADANTPADLLPLLQGRRRATLLADDLQTLGHIAPAPAMDDAMQQTAVPGDARSVFLGRMYVMEGSTLGGQFIAKHLEEHFGLQHGRGNSYFVGYDTETGSRWKEFRAVLADLPESESDTVIASAKNMFDLFGRSMRTPA
jgi:heme oxygenase (biliverdin-IX-beta and delta-forming)